MEYNKRNVAIIGYWFATNYGGVASYYSLYKKVEELDYIPYLVESPYLLTDKEGIDVFSRNFFKEQNARVSDYYSNDELTNLNCFFDVFMLGSDQVLTTSSIRAFGKLFLMTFAKDNKNKIAFSASCGGDSLSIDDILIQKSKMLIERFNYFSVRENSAVGLCEKKFGKEAQRIMDPIFFLTKEKIEEIISNKHHNDEKYMLAYILDPDEDKREGIISLASQLDIDYKIVLDGRKNTHENNNIQMNLADKTLPELDFAEWLSYLSDAEFIFTDSFHGAVMSLILNKPFIVYSNHRRGYTRFQTLADIYGIKKRMIEKSAEIEEALKAEIDFQKINKIISIESEKAENWLVNALRDSEKKLDNKSEDIPNVELNKGNSTVPVPEKTENKSEPQNDPDFVRSKMVVSLVRDYGIKHVVLSSGSRNLNLVRLFEANSCFITHMVIDERSAAFYAMGIAMKLNEPVAICCTSGTAASNYLTGITEAFFSNVPMVVITADRYPCYLGQTEDQTIPQCDIYNGVVKKSVTLPVATDYLSEWQSRRMICDTLLEMTHHGKGPVHINVPIQTIKRLPPDKKSLQLINGMRLISRLELSDSEKKWDEMAKKIHSFKRILIVYGHNTILSPEDQNLVEAFCDKFDCVLLKDHLSNYYGSNGILSFPVLKGISQEKFDSTLAPDLIITLGGKRMLNDPITYKLRGMKPYVEHWRVADDGAVADAFRRLTAVFECSQNYFFRYFIDHAQQSKNEQSYRSIWNEASAQIYNNDHMENYCQKYTFEQLNKVIPSDSLLHIGIGNTIMFSNIYPLNENVEVFSNMGTNGIDGSASTFMGHIAVSDKPAFLVIGDLSFFYDMNSVFNKKLKPNIRIFMSNNDGAGLLRDHNSPAITHEHHTVARAFVESLGFMYLYCTNKEDFDEKLKIFTDMKIEKPIFFEVFT